MRDRCDMSVSIGSLKMKNPVTAASGCFGYGREYARYFDLAKLGGIMVKGTTLTPRVGNPSPRVAETPSGMMNSVGLQNPGVDAFIHKELPWLGEQGLAVIVNINGNTVEEYGELAERLEGVQGVDALEVNVSCPNVKHGGMAFGTNPEMVSRVTETVRSRTTLPVIVKLSPNVTDIGEMAKAAEASGADGISLINTLLGMDIDIKGRRPVFANTFAGLSGPAVLPVALRMVWQVYNAVRIPIVGMGGIASWEDALKFILAGASAISIGTAGFIDPFVWIKTAEGLEEYANGCGCKTIGELVGAARQLPPTEVGGM